MKNQTKFLKGLHDGLPIGLGYLSVSFAFGIMAVSGGLPVWAAVAISMTNLTSAGQVAGLGVIFSGASYLQMALTQLVINIRYALMSLSLSQKLSTATTRLNRFGIAFGITDEIFALAAIQPGEISSSYMYGLICLPFCGWTLGTLLGALAGSVIPAAVQSALGIAIYAMFIAIIIPPAKKARPVCFVVAAALILSSLFTWVPGLNRVSSGYAVIICAVAAAALGALLFPHTPGQEGGAADV